MNTSSSRIVLITGASRGLGRALAAELASRGDRVVLVARRSRDLDEVVVHIRSRGGQAWAIPADVADKHAIHPLVAQATQLAGGPIDVLVNNASTLGPVPLRPLLDTDCEDLEAALAVNLVGAFRLTKAVVGSMVARGRGTVIQISSDAAVQAYPDWGAYSASKAALAHLTRVWAAELASSPGVRLLNLDPGEMDTAMHAQAMPDADRSTLARPEDVARRIAGIV
jgi:NAD(P)-dependent dehydrogenase (short-subunit alcohol dehydrogenase family)